MINLFNFSVFVGIIFEPLAMVIIGLAIALYLFVRKMNRRGYFFASILIIAGILIKLFKEFIQKARPLDMLIQETGYAFPSGHATISVVFFGSLAYLISRNKSQKIKVLSSVIAGILVLITGFTRLYLGVHDVYDVLGGFVLGGIVLVIGILWFGKE
ncbi:MAG: phosphatase PAP2 family protein [Nanoarchaeota archaeon]|nr:phosphatase PAP2 family protein [Nanoarchaeota archaeon]